MSDLKDWQQRVVDEAAELSKKITTLERFISSGGTLILNDFDRTDMNMQVVYMRKYLDILNNRIRRF